MINLLPFSLVIHRAPNFISQSQLFHGVSNNNNFLGKRKSNLNWARVIQKIYAVAVLKFP
jgi:hypothetical protein